MRFRWTVCDFQLQELWLYLFPCLVACLEPVAKRGHSYRFSDPLGLSHYPQMVPTPDSG